MRIELLGHAPNQKAMWAYLKDMGWAKQSEDLDGKLVWHSVGCNLSQIGPVIETDRDGVETKRVDGWHFNLRLYGDAAAKMVKRTRGEDDSFWDYTTYKAEADKLMVRTQTMKMAVKGGLPEGYEDSFHKVRVYPAENVSKRKNVWA